MTTRIAENTLLAYSAMVKDCGIRKAKKDVTKTEDCHLSSLISNVLDYTSKTAVICISSLLMACEPLIFGGISGLGGSSSVSFAQCSSGGPADLSGACRNTPPTPGALEAIGPAVSAGNVNFATSAQLVSTETSLNISWLPYPGAASGYFIFYGPTSDTTTTLASDLSNSTLNFDASAPSVSYQPLLDLGLSAGDTVCFRILAYDTARVPYTWSEVQCASV